MSEPLIGVVGAGGLTGRTLLAQLAASGHRSRAVIRRPELEADVVAVGADEVVTGDLASHDSLTQAFRGLQAVYVICPLFSDQEVPYVVNALKAACDVGVARFVYHSVFQPYTPTLRHHYRKAVAEVAVRDSNLDWTILQPAMYAQTVRVMLTRSGDADLVRIPYSLDARFTVVDIEDVAAAAVKVLCDDGYAFGSFELCGPDALTISTMVEMMGRNLGRHVRALEVPLTDASVPSKWSRSSVADAMAMWAHYDAAKGQVGSYRVLEMLLGRMPRAFADALASR